MYVMCYKCCHKNNMYTSMIKIILDDAAAAGFLNSHITKTRGNLKKHTTKLKLG